MAEILVVDDEAPVREMLVDRLEQMGHTCESACDGMAALQRLRQREYDLILSDVVMPHLNGFDLLRRIAVQIRDRIPFVILSSHDDVEGVEAAIYTGAFDYVLKPGKDHEIRDVVTRALQRRQEWLRKDPTPRGGLRIAEEPAPVAMACVEAPSQSRSVPALVKEKRVLAVPTPADAAAKAASGKKQNRGFLRALRSLFAKNR
jgi:DNA-binding NtrC family response regulator